MAVKAYSNKRGFKCTWPF